MTLFEQLELHEGRRHFVYFDTKGIPSIGIGRNLRDKGLSDDEIDYLLANDIREVFDDLATFPFWEGLDVVRRNVLADLRFNAGPKGFRKFRKMLAAVSGGDYVQAGEELIDSKLPKARKETLARQMKTGIA